MPQRVEPVKNAFADKVIKNTPTLDHILDLTLLLLLRQKLISGNAID
jgi:hypothetical protein